MKRTIIVCDFCGSERKVFDLVLSYKQRKWKAETCEQCARHFIMCMESREIKEYKFPEEYDDNL